VTIKTTLSFTDRHHRFLREKVRQGVFASQSSAVAAALEQMIRDEEEREVAIGLLSDEVRARLETPRSDYLDADDAFAAARARLAASRKA
jgi:Arc/MetJ-type ribon-helix-helix transcriptional regulator